MAQSVKENELAIRKRLKEIGTPERQVEIGVEGVRGLNLVVMPSGVASWTGRIQIGRGKSRTRRKIALGRADKSGLTLREAKEKLAGLISDAEKGIDPIAVQQERSEKLTLRAMFEARCEKDESKSQRTLNDYREVLERDVFPYVGDVPASEITADEFARVLEHIEDRAKHAAHKARSALGSTYSWAQKRRLVKINPVKPLGFTHQSNKRKRVLTDKEIGRLWRAVDQAPNVTEPIKNIVRIAMLTGQRNSECAGMECVELKGLDTETPRWDIPGRRMKRKGDDQYVPLSSQAVAVIHNALEGATETYVFPGTTHGRRPSGEWKHEHIGQQSVSKAFPRIVAQAGLTDLRLHDMRKVITSWLAEHGHASPEVLDAILHHGRPGVTGSHYNFALYEKQVRKALQVWADHVEAVAGGVARPSSKIVSLAKSRA